jgi:hypothetical protein
LNGSTRLSGLAVSGLSYFFKVSSTPDFENKTPSTMESGFEPQNLSEVLILKGTSKKRFPYQRVEEKEVR